MSRGSTVFGVGINDAEYVINQRLGDKRKICPFYITWYGMFRRCYDPKHLALSPTYLGCTVDVEWHQFSTFRAWMEKQEWEGKQLDKDLLIVGNKVYSPNTCVFVSCIINSFITEAGAIRGDWPIGVSFHKRDNVFHANCKNPFTKKKEYLGTFDCPNEAHKAWLKRKQELAILLAAEQTDERVAKAIIDRYMTYGGTND